MSPLSTPGGHRRPRIGPNRLPRWPAARHSIPLRTLGLPAVWLVDCGCGSMSSTPGGPLPGWEDRRPCRQAFHYRPLRRAPVTTQPSCNHGHRVTPLNPGAYLLGFKQSQRFCWHDWTPTGRVAVCRQRALRLPTRSDQWTLNDYP